MKKRFLRDLLGGQEGTLLGFDMIDLEKEHDRGSASVVDEYSHSETLQK